MNNNDVVIIAEERTPRAMWRVGIIDAIIKSHENQIRAATVRCRTPEGHLSLLTRPVNKLVLLETAVNTNIIHPYFVDENLIEVNIL